MSAAVAFAENDNPLKRAMETLNVSKISYSVKELKKPFPEPDRSKLMNMSAYRKALKDGYKVTAFQKRLLAWTRPFRRARSINLLRTKSFFRIDPRWHTT